MISTGSPYRLLMYWKSLWSWFNLISWRYINTWPPAALTTPPTPPALEGRWEGQIRKEVLAPYPCHSKREVVAAKHEVVHDFVLPVASREPLPLSDAPLLLSALNVNRYSDTISWLNVILNIQRIMFYVLIKLRSNPRLHRYHHQYQQFRYHHDNNKNH